MTTYYIFFSVIGVLTLVMTFLVSQNYAPLLVSYITNEKLWNPNSDRIKLTFVIAFFTAPFIFFKQLIKYNSDNFIFNCVCLSLIVLTMAFCTWMIKKVFSINFDLNTNQTKSLQTPIKNNLNSISFNEETFASEKSIDLFIGLIKDIDLYNSKINNFKIDEFIDTINEKDSNVTELRAIQYVIILYITEYLEENINSQNYSELMIIFNTHFNIKSKGKKQELTSSNWNDFLIKNRNSFKKSKFYIKISNEFKKSLEK